MGEISGGSGGGVMGILGPEVLGLTGKTSEGTEEVKMDPITQALATLRLSSIQDALSAMGGWSGLLSNMYSSGESYFNNIMAPQTSQQFGLMGMARSGGRQEALAKGAAQVGQQNFLAQLQSLSGLINQSPYYPQPKTDKSALGNSGIIDDLFGSGSSGGTAVSGLATVGVFG